MVHICSMIVVMFASPCVTVHVNVFIAHVETDTHV